MAGPVEELQRAGFSDDEISAWSVERRSILSQAGFKDNEIDAYFTGGVAAPDTLPPAFIDRLTRAHERAKSITSLPEAITDIPRESWQSTVDTMQSVVKHLVPKTLGGEREPGKEGATGTLQTGAALLDIMSLPFMPIVGAVRSLVGHPMVLADEAIRDGAVSLFGEEAVARAEKERGKKPGPMTYADAKSVVDTALLAIGSRPVKRIGMSATGQPEIVEVGGLPNSADFVNATKVVADETAPRAVQEKLLAAYEQQGRHPAEVAHDAANDPVILQKLLSKDPLDAPYIEAYHASPYDFFAFDTTKIGTGEGAQSYGHGFYFAENIKVGNEYLQNFRNFDWFKNLGREAGRWADLASDGGTKSSGDAVAYLRGKLADDPQLSINDKKNINKAIEALEGGLQPSEANLYRVRINVEKEHLLDWDLPIGEQSPSVKAAIEKLFPDLKTSWGYHLKNGEDVVRALGSEMRGDRPIAKDSVAAAMALREAGIPGIKYLDSGSRRVGNGTRNYVVFDDKLIEITHKNGEPVTPAERREALAASGGGDHSPPPNASAQGPIGGGGGKPPAPGSFEEARGKILDKISTGEREPAGKFTFAHLYKELIDDLHPLKAVSEDAYQMARLTRGQFGKAEYFLERGTFDFNTYRDTGKPLREIMAPVRDDIEGFRAYLASKRALEVEATGRQSGFDVGAAQTVAAAGEKTYGAVARELVGYQNRVLQYLRDSGVLTPEAFDAMVEANKAYVPFFRLIAPEKKPAGGASLGPANPIKRLKGSERDIIDPLESIIKNTYAYVSIAERNAAGIELIDALKAQGFKVEKPLSSTGADGQLITYLKEHGVTEPEKLVDFVKSAMPDEGEVIGAYRNGVREQVKVNDPDLVAAFRGIDRQSVGLLTRIFAVPARTLRAGAVLTPDFMARNLMRDFLTAFVNSKGLFTPKDTLSGLSSVLLKDEAWGDWVKSGGANSAMVALDRRYLQESLQSLTAETGLMTRAWNVLTSPFKPLRMLSETIENATRVGEFKKTAGASKESMQAAAFASREVTLDFARIGARMRAYNMITAFGNAQIQGLDRTVRAFKDRPVNTSLKVAAGITLPSILLWWANKDDQRVKDLPDWQKDLFWIIPTDKWEPISASDAALKPAHLVRQSGDKWEFNNGSIYRLPKPFELGVIFGSGVERVLDRIFNDNPEAMKGFTKSVIERIAPNYLPTAAQPIIEQYANRSTFTDRTLIPADMEKHLPEYQYTPYTTEAAKALGKLISAFPGMRDQAVDKDSAFGAGARALTTPILIENYIRGWSGGLGVYVLNIADAGLRKAGVVPDPVKPAATLADIPFVKAFAVRYPSASAQSIQDFYDEHEKSKKFFDTWMARAKEGDAEAMARIQEAGGPAMFARLDEMKTVLSEHSKLVRDIYKNPKMQPDEKRQIIDGLYYAMIQIARAGRDVQRSIAATPSP